MTATALDAIRLSLTLPAGHIPTDEQRDVLRAFTGWGPLARAFDPKPEGKWLRIADELDDLLTEEAFAAARDQVDTSFFTPNVVTESIYRLLTETGFTGGTVLELGCGAGHIMADAPDDMDMSWVGVEIDPTSARIASLLNPDAKVHTGRLERTALADQQADAVIGNVPFSGANIHDPSYGYTGNLHGYFFHRAMHALRPGGYAVLVTSRNMLDGGDLASLCRQRDVAFIGAVRLPSGVFPATDVPGDIVVLRRNDATHTQEAYPFESDRHTQYADSRPRVGGTAKYPAQPVSHYWEGRWGQVAGEHETTGAFMMPLTVRTDDPAGAIRSAVGELIASGIPSYAPRTVSDDLSDVILESPLGHKEGSFQLWEDGKLVRIENGKYKPVRSSEELLSLVTLRDIAVELLDLEAEFDLDDEMLVPIREVALDQYEAYVTAYGPLNRGTLVEGKVDPDTGMPALSWRRPPMGGFRGDPDSGLVFALEVFDQDTGDAVPAPILTRRVNRRPERIERASSAAEAVAVSLGETGRIDMDRIGGLLGLSGDSLAAALRGLVFYDENGVCVAAAEYLSGNVRAKLDAADRAGLTENVAALREVMPEDLGPLDIHMTPSNPLITADDVRAFMTEELGFTRVSVSVEGTARVWDVDPRNCWGAPSSMDMKYATTDMSLAVIVEHMLMSRMPEVKDRVFTETGDRYVKNAAKSAAAAEKVALLTDRFTTWLWEDKARTDRICSEYNTRFNSHVTREYSGEGFTFPGMADTFTPYAHQRAAVERIVTSERAMIGHPVGSGKTASMIASAVTLRQLGLANKPCIVVPNHLLDQIAREAQQLYPAGRFLIASRDDLARDARRLFAARCATGSWDAVIITHAAFGSIPVHPDSEEAYLDREKQARRQAMLEVDNGSTKGAKAIARAMRSIDAKVGKLRDNMGDAEGTVYFDSLGCDWIAVDEAHLFRRLDTGSTNRDSGFSSGSSKRATDLLVKIETLAEKHPGKPIVGLFTGTPWSNTLAETWVWQRMLQPEQLDDLELRNFDAWTGTFVKYESSIEVAPDGSGFRMFRRPVGVVNAPELKTLFGQVADILDPKALGLDRPTREERTLILKPSHLQAEFVRGLAARADAIRGSGPAPDDAPENDNMLLVCGDGRCVAVDPRLRGIDEDSTKLIGAADRIAQEYHAQSDRLFGSSTTPGAFQLVFLDQGTPKPGNSSSYGRLRVMLTARGVPASRIRFIHDATTDKARAALFASCRDGSVSVLIGSTPKLGMGTNIQTRLTHIWHLDAPWLPADMIQRDGRGDRPYNLAGHVVITRVATEGSFDGFMYAAIARKSRAFDALYSTGVTPRQIEDVSQATLSFEEVKALATGNPLLLQQAKARAEVKRLQMMRAVHMQSVEAARKEADYAESRSKSLRTMADLFVTVQPEVLAVTEADGERMDQFARTVLENRPVTLPWRGLSLQHTYAGALHVGYGRQAVGSLTIDAKVSRRGEVAVARALTVQAEAIVSGLGERIEKYRADAVTLDARAVETRAAVQDASFAEEDALQRALIEAAQIDAAIAEEVVGTPAAV